MSFSIEINAPNPDRRAARDWLRSNFPRMSSKKRETILWILGISGALAAIIKLATIAND